MKKRFLSNRYNDFLFNNYGLRRFIHLSRFYWLRNTIIRRKIKYKNILELGCGDGKTIHFIPKSEYYYYGLDANWEGTLDAAKKQFDNNEKIKFKEIASYKDITIDKKNLYDLVICMETLEHIPPDEICHYLEKLSELSNGYVLITIPNEKGIFFLLKRIFKVNSGIEKYNLKEIFKLTFGKTNSVDRHQHKGFDYDHMIYDIRKYFKIVKIEGIPFRNILPKFLCFNICITAQSIKKK